MLHFLRYCGDKVLMKSLSKNLHVLEAVVCSSMITVMSDGMSHVGDFTHIRWSFYTWVLIIQLIHSQCPLGPFLSSWFLTVNSLVSLIHPVDYIIVIILSTTHKYFVWKIQKRRYVKTIENGGYLVL